MYVQKCSEQCSIQTEVNASVCKWLPKLFSVCDVSITVHLVLWKCFSGSLESDVCYYSEN
jgi:hypothetical protein